MSSRASPLLALALGCAAAQAPPPAGPPPPSATAAEVSEIRLERTPGGAAATGQGYLFILRREGLSTYEGKSGVPMLGEYHVVIPAAGFDALAGRLLANGFVTGRAAWSKGGCPEGPRVRVTLTIAGSAEAFSPPCPGPEFEKAIAAPIDSVAGRLPWSASLRL